MDGAFHIQVHETANRPGRVRRFCFRSIALLLILIVASVAAVAGERQFAKVKWVDDGDTILLVDGRRVRYIGINAPETAKPEYGVRGEPFGYEALKYNIFWVKDKRIVLEFDREKTDQYGRTLAYVHLPGGPLVNRQMIEEGLAYFVFRKPNNRYDQAFLEAQRKAMKAGRGIWGNWRKSNKKWIGNRRSRRFHDPDCPFGQQVSKRNRVEFDTRWEAFWMGYAPAKRCGPDD